MTTVDIKLTSIYNKNKGRVESYSAKVEIPDSPLISQIGLTNLKKFAIDVLFVVASSNINEPEYKIKLTKEEDYLYDRLRHPTKPCEEIREELIKNLNNPELIEGAKNLVQLCLKDKKS